MDILTYVLARKGGGSGDGALTGLSNISLDSSNRLVFELSNGTIITSNQPIPAASEQAIVAAITNNKDIVQENLDIPAALNNTIAAMKEVTDAAVTSVTIPGLTDSNGQDVEFTIENHKLQLPLASGNVPGLVKGASVSNPNNLDNVETENINKIYINDDGSMSVYVLNVNRLVQTDDDELIMGDID